MDLKERASFDDDRLRAQRAELIRLITRIHALPVPAIAAVEGYALAGGFELALACDLIVASRAAVFGLPEVAVGIFPGGGSTQTLTWLVGPARARDVILTGRRLTADEAEAWGVVARVVDEGTALEGGRARRGHRARRPPRDPPGPARDRARPSVARRRHGRRERAVRDRPRLGRPSRGLPRVRREAAAAVHRPLGAPGVSPPRTSIPRCAASSGASSSSWAGVTVAPRSEPTPRTDAMRPPVRSRPSSRASSTVSVPIVVPGEPHRPDPGARQVELVDHAVLEHHIDERRASQVEEVRPRRPDPDVAPLAAGRGERADPAPRDEHLVEGGVAQPQVGGPDVVEEGVPDPRPGELQPVELAADEPAAVERGAGRVPPAEVEVREVGPIEVRAGHERRRPSAATRPVERQRGRRLPVGRQRRGIAAMLAP